MKLLNPANVPTALIPLLPTAERWGIGDDFEREDAIRRASRDELEQLIHSIDEVSDEELFGWLSGAESYDEHPTDEYVAITCLTMAIESAKHQLKRMDSP